MSKAEELQRGVLDRIEVSLLVLHECKVKLMGDPPGTLTEHADVNKKVLAMLEDIKATAAWIKAEFKHNHNTGGDGRDDQRNQPSAN